MELKLSIRNILSEKRKILRTHVMIVSNLLFIKQTNHDINAGNPVMNNSQHIVLTTGFSI